jgi:hypothetical protein
MIINKKLLIWQIVSFLLIFMLLYTSYIRTEELKNAEQIGRINCKNEMFNISIPK